MPRYLVQLMLPLYDEAGQRFGRDAYARVKNELTDRFGGTTAYTRAPAEGTWEDPAGRVHHDDVIVVEVMADTLDREWWARYAGELETRFRQDTVLIRAIAFEEIGAKSSNAQLSGG